MYLFVLVRSLSLFFFLSYKIDAVIWQKWANDSDHCVVCFYLLLSRFRFGCVNNKITPQCLKLNPHLSTQHTYNCWLRIITTTTTTTTKSNSDSGGSDSSSSSSHILSFNNSYARTVCIANNSYKWTISLFFFFFSLFVAGVTATNSFVTLE